MFTPNRQSPIFFQITFDYTNLHCSTNNFFALRFFLAIDLRLPDTADEWTGDFEIQHTRGALTLPISLLILPTSNPVHWLGPLVSLTRVKFIQEYNLLLLSYRAVIVDCLLARLVHKLSPQKLMWLYFVKPSKSIGVISSHG